MSANIQELAMAIGFKKQAALQTPLVAADCWSLIQTNRSIGQPILNTESNAKDLGKGDEWSSLVFPVSWDAPWQWEAYLTSENAAMLFGFGLGKVTKASSGDGFKYTCVPMVPGTDGIELPSTTVVQAIQQGGSPVFDYALIGMVLESFSIRLQSGPGRDNATMTSQWQGCGKHASPSTITIPAPTTEHILNAGGAVSLTILAKDYISNLRFISAEMGFANAPRLNTGFYPGSGTQDGANIRGRMRHGDRTATLNFSAEFAAGSTELDDFLDQTEGTAIIQVDGGLITAGTPDIVHRMKVTYHRIRFKSAVLGESDGLVKVDVQCEVMKHSTNGVLTAEITTTHDNIMAAAA